MSTIEKRRHLRTPLKLNVSVTHPAIGTLILNMRDMSDSGVFLITEQHNMPAVGSVVELQVQGLLDEAPIIKARIMRSEKEGIGLEFCE